MRGPSLQGPWSIGEESLHVIRRYSPTTVRRVMEFGSGPSTVRLAQTFPEAEVISFEHSEKYAEETRALLARYDVSERVKLVTYQKEILYEPPRRRDLIEQYQDIDVCLVDGPPRAVAKGRLHVGLSALEMLRPGSARSGGLLVLDDARRAPERAALDLWKKLYDLSFSIVSVGHGLALVWRTE